MNWHAFTIQYISQISVDVNMVLVAVKNQITALRSSSAVTLFSTLLTVGCGSGERKDGWMDICCD